MHKLAFCASSALAACLYAPQAFAATATAEATTPSAVSEITVVATKREEDIQRVPVAVTAFGSEQRKLMGIVIIQDLADFSPSLNWTDIDDRVYIRGIGRNSDNLNNTSGVAIYYNGIYYGANAAIEQQKSDLFIGNIEVDNGPQNTLHGSNADGGIVQFTSKHPTDTWYGEVRTGVANYDTTFVEAIVSGPINDHLKFRLGGNFTSQNAGFFHNFDGPDQGGNLVLGGNGNTEYFEAQLEGRWDHLDAWIQASTGDFIANTHGAATIGSEPTTHSTVANGLTPNDFYGLCGLQGVPGSANDVGGGCEEGPIIVPGSVKHLAFTADMFPGNNPGNLDKHNFLETFNGINSMTADVQISAHVTYHMPSFDIAYLGGYQNFHYVLAIPDQYGGEINAGILSWQEQGAASAGEATSCLLAGNPFAACHAPLNVVPNPDYLTFDEFDQAFSHEINIISTTSSPLQYVAGLYWYRERWNQPVDQYATPAQPQMGAPVYYNLLGGGPAGLCPGGGIFNEFQTCAAPANPTFAGSSENTAVTYNSYAVFGEFSYKFNDDWKFTGAVRYTSDHKAGWQTWRVVSFDQIITSNSGGFLSGWGSATPALDITALAACTQAPPAPCEPAFPGAGPTTMNPVTGNAQRTIKDTWSAVTGEANLNWTPNASTLAYAKYSRGYKSGGWSTYTIGPLPEVGAEYVDAFEVGAKKTIGHEWTLNGDVFYYNYTGEQVPLSVVNQIGQIVPILYNLPEVHTWGIELWGTWRPIDNAAISLSYSHLSAKIAKSACVLDTTDPLAQQPGANPAGCPVNGDQHTQSIVGQTIPGATPNKLSLNALYTWDFGPGKLTLSGTFIWRDGTFDDVFNRWYTFQPASTQVNFRATLTGPKNRYNIIAFVNNAFDTTAYDGSTGGLLGTFGGKEHIVQYPFLNAPRTYGLQLQYRWQ